MEFEFPGRKFTVDETRRLNPLAMAFVGDTVFELAVRSHLVGENTELSAHKLHVKAISYVKAHAQCELMKILEGKLTVEEEAIFKRGRNTKSPSVPKNADVQEYRIATGLETLIGYLFLSGQRERLTEILQMLLK
jgi:ribonuclease-3 family protein